MCVYPSVVLLKVECREILPKNYNILKTPKLRNV